MRKYLTPSGIFHCGIRNRGAEAGARSDRCGLRTLPLTFHDGVLTVAVSERSQFALDDVKHFTGVRQLRSLIKPIDEIEDGIAKAYA
jgi:hypothetical protein